MSDTTVNCGQCSETHTSGRAMAGTDPENTRWIEIWVVNDGDYYSGALNVAECPIALREYVQGVLTAAPEESSAWYVAREMSEGDYDRVDWQEIGETLLSE